MLRAGAIVLGLGLFVAVSSAEAGPVDVRMKDGRVDVKATSVRLTEILTRLSDVTGMKVAWDEPHGTPIVSAVIEDRTPAQAVDALFEGLGLKYVMKLDATGQRVELLMISNSGLRPNGGPPARDTTGPVTPAPVTAVDQLRRRLESERAEEVNRAPEPEPQPEEELVAPEPDPEPADEAPPTDEGRT